MSVGESEKEFKEIPLMTDDRSSDRCIFDRSSGAYSGDRWSDRSQ